ncbi:MAG: ribonuclease III [Myxococcales bacterium]
MSSNGTADADRVRLLEERLGLTSGSIRPDIALQALRHGSYVHERRLAGEVLGSNERLEFLGDSVLGLAVAVRCFERFPDAPEGDLTRIRASLVNSDALAHVSREIDLGSLLLLGRGEERSGGREKQSLLADALEAVVAAVYLSCGLDSAVALIDRLFATLFDAAASGTLARDYKTELQERLQGLHRGAPAYNVLDAPGPQHARIFEVEVTSSGVALGRGSGRTKKEAEQAAARVALDAELPDAPPPAQE